MEHRTDRARRARQAIAAGDRAALDAIRREVADTPLDAYDHLHLAVGTLRHLPRPEREALTARLPERHGGSRRSGRYHRSIGAGADQ